MRHDTELFYMCTSVSSLQDSRAERFLVDHEANLRHTWLEGLLCSEHAFHRILLAVLAFMIQFCFVLFYAGSHI